MDLTTGGVLSSSLLLLLSVGCVTPPPKIAPPAGIYACPRTITLSDAKSETQIYYTTDGTTPSSSSSKYSAPFPLNATGKIQAIAQSGGKASASTSADFGCAMTRAEFAVLLQQEFSLPPPVGKYVYQDVPSNDRVSTAVQAAAPYMNAQVLCPGCQLPLDFYPNQPVTQATLALAFVRVLITSGKVQLASPQQTASLLAKSPDVLALPSAARPYFATAIAHNILVPSPSGEVRPTALVTQSDVLRIVEHVRTELGTQQKSPG